MAGFLKEYPMYTEFQYNWNLSIEKRMLMLLDAPRVEYDSIKDEKKPIKTGNLNEIIKNAKKYKP